MYLYVSGIDFPSFDDFSIGLFRQCGICGFRFIEQSVKMLQKIVRFCAYYNTTAD
jgi:hypothetical protein